LRIRAHLIFGSSPFDRYVTGDHDYLRRGKLGCSCSTRPVPGRRLHSGFNFNGNLGTLRANGQGGVCNNALVTRQWSPTTQHRVTAPYMHDGRLHVDAVLITMPASHRCLGRCQAPTFNLSADERADLIAFLQL